MKHFFTALFFIVGFQQIIASPQMPDYLIYKGDTIPIFSNPLESYLEKNNLQNIDRGCNSSACNRGYIALWELTNNKLYLVEIKRCELIASAGVYTGLECEENKLSEILSYFQLRFKSQKIVADWYTGELISPQGRLIEYIHGGYLSKYEREEHFCIKDGTLTDSKIVNNKIKPELFDSFNYSLAVDTLFQNISKLDWKYLSDELICTDSYLITINKRGRVSKVKIEPLLNSKWEDFWYNFTMKDCRRSVFKSIRNLEISKYLKGKPKKMVVKISLEYINGELRLSY